MDMLANSRHPGAAGDIGAAMRPVGGRIAALILTLTAIFVAVLIEMCFTRIVTFPADIADAAREDFMAFWQGARLALEGNGAINFDRRAFTEALPPQGAGLLWLNPPHFFLLVAPFGLLPYGAAKALWLALSISAMAAIARLAAPKSMIALALILFSPGMFAHMLAIQTGPFVALGLLAALLLARDRPIMAGLALALLTVKPQYGLLIPVYMAACGHWRVFAVTIGAGLLMLAFSLALFGVAPWQAFLGAMTGAYASHGGLLHVDMLSVHQTAGKLGANNFIRSLAQIAALAVSAGAVWFAAKRWSREDAIGLTLLLSAFVSPSLWVYDWMLIAAGLFMLARTRTEWPLALQCLAGALWAAPLVSLGAGTYESALFAPFIFTLTIIGFMVWKWRRPPNPENAIV